MITFTFFPEKNCIVIW